MVRGSGGGGQGGYVMTLDALLAHPDVARLARALAASPGRRVEPTADVRWAAIAVTLRLGDAGEPELLLIKRAEAEGDPWSGHIACPGGRSDPEDGDLEYTAVRETREETGLDLSRVGRILGTLDDLHPRTPFLPPIAIRPFVAAMPSGIEIVPSAEVASWFWVPLSALRASGAWATETVTVRGAPREEPAFRFGEHLVWGLTERVLRQFAAYLAV